MSLHSTTPMLWLALVGLVLATACAPAGDRATYDRVDRQAFNRAAVRLNLPLFWVADGDGDGAVSPDEVVALLFYPSDGHWVEDGRFTPDFETAYARIVEEAARTDVAEQGLDPAEVERRRLVGDDLDAGIATLVHTDLRDLPADHRAFARHMLRVAELADRLFAIQNGSAALAAQVPTGDPASQSLFRRNLGPRCVAPGTEQNPACSAIPGAPTPVVDAYPASLQADEGFCERLEGDPRAESLLDPFVVVRERSGELFPIPLPEAYPEEMAEVASELRAAADVLTDENEGPLRAYLRAAAQAFTDNDWTPADEAWAAMDARSSRWYVRIAPDEVYWDPCSQKAGFHLTFALINRDSLAWQERLSPVRQAMEDELAALIGPPYEARRVAFHLPDFIDIVLNAGNDRSPLGATIGESLPNWGPVAEQGRGRTVAMSNLYTDPDSLETRRAQAVSLLDEATMRHFSDEAAPGLLATILHEATHNLGPAHEYRVRGMVDGEVFGGGLASTLEELKAQCGALYYLELLRARGLISDELVRQSYAEDLVWAFGHISRGMYTASGKRKPYSQLAAIQVGFLLEAGAIHFDAEAPAANGQDRGVFSIDFEQMPAAVERMMRVVGQIKGRGDRAGAEALATKMVDGELVPQQLVTERMTRYPKASFVYAVDF